jgi:uncharacterized membrane protein YhaH (DUF805 family)
MIWIVSYSNFFVGSLTVAGALTGLLFVALSVAQEKASVAEPLERQAVAATAFTALVDALWVSLIALLPGGAEGDGLSSASLILGLLGLSSTITLTVRLWRARSKSRLSNRWPVVLPVIAIMYGAQAVTAFTSHTAHAALSHGATFVMIFFAVGIARSWELLGLRGGGVLDLLTGRQSAILPPRLPGADPDTGGDRVSEEPPPS